MLTPKPEKPQPRDSSDESAEPRSRFAEPRTFAEPARRPAPAPQALSEHEQRKRALIVIPTLNEAWVIARVLAQILDDERLVDPLVVVADGGSTDGTREIVCEISQRDTRVRLLDNPARLQSAGLNRAVAAMAGDRPWLVRVDAHSEYPKNYASCLIDEALRTNASSVVVSVNTVGETVFQRAVAAAQNSRLGTGGSLHRKGGGRRWVDHGHHGLCKLSAYRRVGGYDESFSHNEDAELDIRLARSGARIWLTDRVRSNYHPRRTPRALLRQYFNYGRGRARTVLKHRTPLKLRQALPLAVAPAVASLALAPVFWPFAGPALAWAAVSVTYGAGLAIQQADAALLLSGPAAMIMHLGWSTGFWIQLLSRRGEPRAPAALPAVEEAEPPLVSLEEQDVRA
jgi:succinoglycan biosynthesis protein ExoA